MVTNKRLKSVFLVNTLNMSALAKTVVSFLIGNGHEFDGNTRIKSYAPLGIVTGKNGKHYLIDTEGCGSGVALEDAPETIDWYKKTLDEKGDVTSFDMLPFVEVTLNKDELEVIPVSCVVTLDEFVRTSGGDRLERNFGNWNKFLATGINPKY